MTENEIAKQVVDVCYKVHTTLGPGLFESAYESVLVFEFENRGMKVEKQRPILLIYEGIQFDEVSGLI